MVDANRLEAQTAAMKLKKTKPKPGAAALAKPAPPEPKVLREYRMKFEKVPAGKAAIPDLDKIGMRSKLGGKPDWCQSAKVPNCSDCGAPMSFIAQIDSMEHKEGYNPHAVDYDKQDYMFADVGMIYVFMCFDCMETQSVLQCG